MVVCQRCSWIGQSACTENDKCAVDALVNRCTHEREIRKVGSGGCPVRGGFDSSQERVCRGRLLCGRCDGVMEWLVVGGKGGERERGRRRKCPEILEIFKFLSRVFVCVYVFRARIVGSLPRQISDLTAFWDLRCIA